MKKYIVISTTLILLISLFVFSSCSKGFIEQDGSDSQIKTHLKTSKITITFSDAPDNYSISVPALKYNKDFCLGFHLDDGNRDVFSYAFKLLNGGEIEGAFYEGLKYTDGCGNDENFKMSTSIYSMANDELTDIHLSSMDDRLYLTWAEISKMYLNGWGIYNHGLSAVISDDPLDAIVKNHNHVKLMTKDSVLGGINMRILVVPEGETSYSGYAFQQNYRMAFTEDYPFGKPYFNVMNSWNKSYLRMGRSSLPDAINLPNLVDEIAALSINGAHYWSSVFSHSVSNGNYGFSFESFKNDMKSIAEKYGKNGYDNIWMTTEEEMLDYSILKDLIVIHESLNANKLELTFSGNIPEDLRFYSTSLIISSNSNITSIEIDGTSNSSYNGLNSNKSLINIDYTDL